MAAGEAAEASAEGEEAARRVDLGLTMGEEVEVGSTTTEEETEPETTALTTGAALVEKASVEEEVAVGSLRAATAAR